MYLIFLHVHRNLQKENEKIRAYQKILDKFLMIEFGLTRNEILKHLTRCESSLTTVSEFEKKIRQYFGLKTDRDRAGFLNTMCNENSKNFFAKNRTKAAEKQTPASGDRNQDLRQ